jgi:homogentisate solanesyltransferase
LGVAKVAQLAVGMLLVNYMGAIFVAITRPTLFNAPVMVGVHAVMAVVIVYRAIKLHADKYSQAAIQDFYRSVRIDI